VIRPLRVGFALFALLTPTFAHAVRGRPLGNLRFEDRDRTAFAASDGRDVMVLAQRSSEFGGGPPAFPSLPRFFHFPWRGVTPSAEGDFLLLRGAI